MIRSTLSQQAKLRLYYAVRPLVPQSWRLGMRGLLARRRRKEFSSTWPIDPSAAQPPPNWRGWPEGKAFAVVLTHDVEGKQGLANCQSVADLEASLGFRSSFNLVPEGAYQHTSELRQSLASKGFEIGVHDLHHDGSLYHSHSRFRQCAQRINHHLHDWSSVGYRSGFMMHNYEWHHELDVEYDASSFDTDPFEPQPDGVGTIFPLWMPAPEGLETRRGGYIELPYTLPQDSTLFLVLKEKTPEIWLRKLDWVAKNGGMVLVNMHPDYVQRPGARRGACSYPIDHYATLLRTLQQRYSGQYWHCLPREMARFAYSNLVLDRP